MQTSSTNDRALATAAGLAFLIGSLVILFGDWRVLLDPKLWGQYHVLTLLMIGGTIAAGHLTKTAWKARSPASLGFALLFLAGTALVVYNSVGRQAEAHDTVTLEAEARNGLIEDKHRDIENARQRLRVAEQNADRERGSKCKTLCQDWERAASDARKVISVLESEVRALGAPKPVDAKAAKAGELAAVFGYDRQQVAAAAALIEPFLWTVFFEIGSVISFGFAFRHGPAPVPVMTRIAAPVQVSDTSGQTDYPSASDADLSNVRMLFAANDDPSGPDGGSKIVRRWSRDEVRADLTARIERGEQWPSQRSLAMTYGVPTSTLHDWFLQWSDEGAEIERTRVGRRKVVG